MSGLHADTSAINANGQATVENAALYADELARLRSNIETLMGIWRGPSASEFNNSYEAQNENFQAFQRLLNELGESISKGASILNDAEESNAAAGRNLF